MSDGRRKGGQVRSRRLRSCSAPLKALHSCCTLAANLRGKRNWFNESGFIRHEQDKASRPVLRAQAAPAQAGVSRPSPGQPPLSGLSDCFVGPVLHAPNRSRGNPTGKFRKSDSTRPLIMLSVGLYQILTANYLRKGD